MLAVARSVTADAGQRNYRSYRLPQTRIDRTFFESALHAPQVDGVHRYKGASDTAYRAFRAAQP